MGPSVMRFGRSAAAVEVGGDRNQARRLCIASFIVAALLYLASPFAALWSVSMALQRHDEAALCASLDWKLVRASLKQSLGLKAGVQNVSEQDDLPAFGASFANNIASGMIDDDITPQRLNRILTAPAMRQRRSSGWPRGFFASPDRFVASLRSAGEAPVVISMHVERWRWKITSVAMPADMVSPAVVAQN